jgi:hypothetical protein
MLFNVWRANAERSAAFSGFGRAGRQRDRSTRFSAGLNPRETIHSCVHPRVVGPPEEVTGSVDVLGAVVLADVDRTLDDRSPRDTGSGRQEPLEQRREVRVGREIDVAHEPGRPTPSTPGVDSPTSSSASDSFTELRMQYSWPSIPEPPSGTGSRTRRPCGLGHRTGVPILRRPSARGEMGRSPHRDGRPDSPK